MDSFLFNEHYKLRTAVVEGKKTMTRRLVGDRMTPDDIAAYMKGYTDVANRCAPYKIDDVVAVAEPYKNIFEPDILLMGSKIINGKRKKGWYPAIELGGWNNSMFICPEYMKHFVRITDVKIERLHEISEEDALKEGIYGEEVLDAKLDLCYAYTFYPALRHYETAREAFSHLIDKVSGKGTWEANKLVFCYSFKLLK